MAHARFPWAQPHDLSDTLAIDFKYVMEMSGRPVVNQQLAHACDRIWSRLIQNRRGTNMPFAYATNEMGCPSAVCAALSQDLDMTFPNLSSAEVEETTSCCCGASTSITHFRQEVIGHAEALPLEASIEEVMTFANQSRKTITHLADESDSAVRFRQCTTCKSWPTCTQSMPAPATFLRISAKPGQGREWGHDFTVYHYGVPYTFVGIAAHTGAHWIALLSTAAGLLLYDDMKKQGELCMATPLEVDYIRSCSTTWYFVRDLDKPRCDDVVLTQHQWPEALNLVTPPSSQVA
jgi:hypothetical protein